MLIFILPFGIFIFYRKDKFLFYASIPRRFRIVFVLSILLIQSLFSNNLFIRLLLSNLVVLFGFIVCDYRLTQWLGFIGWVLGFERVYRCPPILQQDVLFAALDWLGLLKSKVFIILICKQGIVGLQSFIGLFVKLLAVLIAVHLNLQDRLVFAVVEQIKILIALVPREIIASYFIFNISLILLRRIKLLAVILQSVLLSVRLLTLVLGQELFLVFGIVVGHYGGARFYRVVDFLALVDIQLQNGGLLSRKCLLV